MSALAGRLGELIRREGPIAFDAFMELALYGDGGFFTEGGGAGRSGADFVTSPEVGPLFGALVARALDRWWDQLDRPDPFFVVEAGAGRGRLAADVLHAEPACANALRYVLVERSGALRAAQRELLHVEPFEDAIGPVLPSAPGEAAEAVPGSGPIVTALEDLPSFPIIGVVLANELLDNLPFGIVERSGEGWREVRVGIEGDRLVELTLPAAPAVGHAADVMAGAARIPDGARIPLPAAAQAWVRRVAQLLDAGFLAVVDYMATPEELVEREMTSWLRTYRSHERAASPLDDPGACDITADVPSDGLTRVAGHAGLELVRDATQAEWLEELGLEELTAAAREGWRARAHIGDLEAVTHRSRVSEAAALTDPAGLGAHRVLVFRR